MKGRIRYHLRRHAPSLRLAGWIGKARDCGEHRWYKATESRDDCYFCERSRSRA